MVELAVLGQEGAMAGAMMALLALNQLREQHREVIIVTLKRTELERRQTNHLEPTTTGENNERGKWPAVDFPPDATPSRSSWPRYGRSPMCFRRASQEVT